MKDQKKSSQVGFASRIPRETYDDLQILLSITRKTTSQFAQDAIGHYIQNVKTSKCNPSDALKIDQFAWQLHKKSNP